MIFLYISVLAFLTWFSGYSKAIMDIIAHKYESSIFTRKKNNFFWNPYFSWRNKWKNGNKKEGEAFLGSSTIFVWYTDAWHRYQMYYGISVCLLSFLIPIIFKETIVYISIFVTTQILYRGVFELYYRKLLIKK